MPIKFHNLVSFALFGDRINEGLHPEWNTMLDSGGFTNFVRGKDIVTLKDYCMYLKTEKVRFWEYMALDRIGDKKISGEYLNKMISVGLAPVPIYQRGEGSAKELTKMIEANRLIAIGGISQNLSAKAEQEYLRNVMRVVRKVPTAKVHLLGVGVREAKLYCPYSSDSSTWASHFRFGIIRLWHQGKLLDFQKHKTAQHAKRYVRPNPNYTRCLAKYSLTWNDLYDNADWSKPESKLSIAATRSWIRQSRSLYRKDSRYLLASLPINVQAIKEAWNYERISWGWPKSKFISIPSEKK